jgi:hypothetical protein
MRISLYDKVGETPIVTLHPEFVDFELRDSVKTTAVAVVEIADDNTVGAILKGCDGRLARDAYHVLLVWAQQLVAEFPTREDGARVLSLMIGWTQRYPDTRLAISGGELVQAGDYFIHTPWIPRIATSVAVDPVTHEFLSDPFARMDHVTPKETGSLLLHTLTLDDSIQDIPFDDRILQKENRIERKSSRSKGRSRKDDGKRTIKERNEDTDRSLQDDGRNPREVLTQRISSGSKETYDQRTPSEKREVFEAIARAWQSGRTTEQILAGLEQHA